MKRYIIEVEGEIVADAKIHYAQDWVCCDISSSITNENYNYNKETHSVTSNLILNENRRAVPYAIYFSKKGISTNRTGDISACQGYPAAFEYYKENIDKISNLLKCECEVPKKIEHIIYNGLYTDVFSILELFLSDFILCMIYSNEIVYENAIHYYHNKHKNCKNVVSNIEREIHDFFFKGVVYHRFNEVEKMFTQIIGIRFPNKEKLS